ncbi:hypothetical protein TNCV_3055851 [Trichonephila clavipes]|nr:hypothetical protein TNCV_3055851 [Trichonephila clavipes]
MQSLLKEVENDRAREEPIEIMHINHDRESKFGKSDEHKTFELKVYSSFLSLEFAKRFRKSYLEVLKKELKTELFQNVRCHRRIPWTTR